MKKLKNFFAVLFCIAGIALTATSVLIKAEDVYFMKTAVKTNAVITNISRTRYRRNTYHVFQYCIYIRYTANEKTYAVYFLQYGKFGLDKGDKITVYYDPANPYYFRRESNFELYFFLCLVVGIGFIILGVVIKGYVLYDKKQEKKYKRLKVKGKRVEAHIDKITMDSKFSQRTIHTYFIHCSYYDHIKNCTYEFRSAGIPSDMDLELFAEIHNITVIPVYMNEKNPQKYVVDVNKFQSFVGKQ